MRRISLLPILSAALLTSLSARADESRTDDEASPADSSAAAAALLENLRRYSTRWQLRETDSPIAYGDDFSNPLFDIRFEDGSMISRVSKIRRLSLLTFAEVGDAQLYFGVNRDGLFGVHLGALSGSGRERQLEVARMPYLEAREPESERDP